MWSTIIPGLFALGGTALGVLLEPLKGMFSSRARTRQLRGERCADVLRAATTLHRALLRLHEHQRAKLAQQPTMHPDHLIELSREMSQARTDLRLAAALIRLHGPDDLADKAEAVVEAEQALFLLARKPETDPLALVTPPTRLHQASDDLDLAVSEFAKAARSSTQ